MAYFQDEDRESDIGYIFRVSGPCKYFLILQFWIYFRMNVAFFAIISSYLFDKLIYL
jgi:hypothetical protein